MTRGTDRGVMSGITRVASRRRGSAIVRQWPATARGVERRGQGHRHLAAARPRKGQSAPRDGQNWTSATRAALYGHWGACGLVLKAAARTLSQLAWSILAFGRLLGRRHLHLMNTWCNSGTCRVVGRQDHLCNKERSGDRRRSAWAHRAIMGRATLSRAFAQRSMDFVDVSRICADQ